MSNIASNMIRRMASPFHSPAQRGWVGIDLGNSAVKLAQVQQQGNDLQLVSRWAFCNGRRVLTRDDFRQELSAATHRLTRLRRLFHGRTCSVTLPMSVVDFRSLELPRGTPVEQRQMISSEIAGELGVEPSELAFDAWEIDGDAGQDPGMARFAVLALKHSLATELSEQLLSAGLECKALDGLPCAIARAVTLSDAGDVDAPVAAIDLGYCSPTLVLISKGRPVFSRSLRGCGLSSLMQPLESNLQISADECQQLLVRFGLPALGEVGGVASQTIMRMIGGQLAHLVSEVERTLEYIAHQFRGQSPRRLLVLGGGATIRNLPQFLEHKLHLPVHPWRLRSCPHDVEAPLYAVAAALSCIAWEDRGCT